MIGWLMYVGGWKFLHIVFFRPVLSKDFDWTFAGQTIKLDKYILTYFFQQGEQPSWFWYQIEIDIQEPLMWQFFLTFSSRVSTFQILYKNEIRRNQIHLNSISLNLMCHLFHIVLIIWAQSHLDHSTITSKIQEKQKNKRE